MLIFALVVALGAYLIGSIPSGYLVGRAKGVDLRKVGSGNIGATNALRVLGKKWGYLVFAADIFKGWLSVRAGFAGLAIVSGPSRPSGHSGRFLRRDRTQFSRLARLQGRKGIATSAGIMIALFPLWVFLFALVVWVAFFYGTRYVSVASIAAASVCRSPAASCPCWKMRLAAGASPP